MSTLFVLPWSLSVTPLTFKWIFRAVSLFSLTEWIRQNVCLHTRSPRYIYKHGRFIRFLERELITTSLRCLQIHQIRIVSHNHPLVSPTVQWQPWSKYFFVSLGMKRTTWLLYDFLIFKKVACTYHVNKLFVIDLMLCLKLHPLQQTVWLPKNMTQIYKDL